MMHLPQKPFYFIRHGETEWNKLKIVMGSKDIPLNDLGFKQAHEAALILAKENFDLIISSPRIRAQQTAEVIVQETKKPIVFEPNLTERIWGEAEGKPVDPIQEDNIKNAPTPQGAETFSVFQNRVLETVSSLLLKKELPLLVSHNGVFKVLMHHFGYESMNSSNCTPFLFKPSDKSLNRWLVCPLQ